MTGLLLGGQCIGCQATCKNGCNMGCGLACQSNCTLTCKNSCNGGCGGECVNSCDRSCGGKCATGCHGLCISGCYQGCVQGCANGCGDKCTTACKAQCSGSCKGGCAGGCYGSCKNGCGGCDNTCTSCTGNCKGGCYLACQGACETQCSGGAMQSTGSLSLTSDKKILSSTMNSIISALKYEISKRKITVPDNLEQALYKTGVLADDVAMRYIVSCLTLIRHPITLSIEEGAPITANLLQEIINEIKEAWNELVAIPPA